MCSTSLPSNTVLQSLQDTISLFGVTSYLLIDFHFISNPSKMSTSPDLSTAATSAEDASVVSSSSSSVAPLISKAKQHRQDRESQKIREMTILPKDFEPQDTDVVIGRGKKARTHVGNQRLRGLIEFMIPEYSAAGSNKDEKSYIIKEIVTQIRKSSPDGGFVKYDKAQNRWFEVGDFL